jgi:hypothetical protein
MQIHFYPRCRTGFFAGIVIQNPVARMTLAWPQLAGKKQFSPMHNLGSQNFDIAIFAAPAAGLL